MIKPRKIPMRKGAGCGVQKPKKELIRVVRSPEGEVSVDITGKKNGRGAYVCGDAKCLAAMRKSNRLGRVLEVSVPQEIYDELEKISAGYGQE